jgi:hypothetical protein
MPGAIVGGMFVCGSRWEMGVRFQYKIYRPTRMSLTVVFLYLLYSEK